MPGTRLIPLPKGDRVTFSLDGEEVSARAGETVAAALLAADKISWARSPKLHRPRGAACQRGGCDGCLARIDGVPPWARFLYITLPMLKPVILFTTVISTIGTLQLFDEPYNITQGGPSQATLTLSYYIYDLTFRFMPSFGYSATVSWVIVVLVGILTFVQFLVAREGRRA